MFNHFIFRCNSIIKYYNKYLDKSVKKFKELFGCIKNFKVYFLAHNSDSNYIYIFIKHCFLFYFINLFCFALLKHDLLSMAVLVVHIQAIHFLHLDQLQSFVEPTQFYRENGCCCSGPVETDKWREICEVHIWSNSHRAGIKGERLCICSVARGHLNILRCLMQLILQCRVCANVTSLCCFACC